MLFYSFLSISFLTLIGSLLMDPFLSEILRNSDEMATVGVVAPSSLKSDGWPSEWEKDLRSL